MKRDLNAILILMILAGLAVFPDATKGQKVDGANQQLKKSPEVKKDSSTLNSEWFVGESVKVIYNNSGTNNTLHIRSKYCYVTEISLRHKLELVPLSITSTIVIFAPLAWNFSNEEFSGSYSWVGDDLKLESIPSSLFYVFFSSGNGYGRDNARQKLLVCIDDVSGNYLHDGSFEGGWAYDWSNNTYGLGSRSIALNQTVMFEGASSIRLQGRNAINQFDNTPNLLLDGYYYLSFALYIESTPTNYSHFNWYDGGTFGQLVIDTSILNRWKQYFLFFHIEGKDNWNRNIIFSFAKNGTFFIDAFHIYLANPSAKTISYQKVQFSATLRSWDGRQDPGMPFTNLSMSLHDRTANNEQWKLSLITDNIGYAEYLWDGTLQQSEYELRVWAWDSWWGSPNLMDDWTERREILKYFHHGDFTNASESRSTDAVVGHYSYQVNASETNDVDNYIYLDSVNNFWDISQCDYFVFWVKTDVPRSNRATYLLDSNYSFYLYKKSWSVAADTWTFSVVEIKKYSNESGTVDLTSMKILRIDTDIVNGSILIKYDGVRCIQAQKNYFTPFPDYQYSQVTEGSANGWDLEKFATVALPLIVIWWTIAVMIGMTMILIYVIRRNNGES